MRQFAWLLTSRLAGALLQAANLVVIARYAGPSDLGIVMSVAGVFTVLSALTDFGVGAYLTKVRAATPNSSHIAGAIYINRLASLFLFLTGALALVVLGQVIQDLFFYMIPLALWAAGDKLTEGLLSLAVADGDTRENAISVIGRRAIALSMLIPLITLTSNPILAYSASQAMSGILGATFAYIRLHSRIPIERRAPFTEVLKASWPFWLNTAAAQIRNLDMSLVTFVATSTVSGIYAIPSRLTSPLRMIPTTLAQVALPTAARKTREGMRALLRAVLLVMGVMTLVLSTVALLAPTIIRVLGDGYEEAVLPLQILCGGLLFASLASFMNSVLQGHTGQNRVAFVSLTTGIYSLTAVTVGAILGGAAGATIGLSSSFVFQVALLTPATWMVVRSYRD